MKKFFRRCDINLIFSVDLLGNKRNEEPVSGGSVRFAWTDRRPSATNSDFPVYVFQLHLELDRELNNYLSHPAGSSPQDSNVLLSPEFLLLGNGIHIFLHSTILDEHSHWRQNNYLQCLCSSIVLLFSTTYHRVLPPGCHVL